MDGLLVQLRVALHHQLLERHEVFHRRDLIHDLLVQRVRTRLVTRIHELVLSHSQLRHEFTEQRVHQFLEFLLRLMRIDYLMDLRVFQLVFLFRVEYQTVLVQETHYGRFPSGRTQEVYYYIEEPVLNEVRAMDGLRFQLQARRCCSYLK